MATKFNRPLRGLADFIFAFPPLKTAGYCHPSRAAGLPFGHAAMSERRDQIAHSRDHVVGAAIWLPPDITYVAVNSPF